MSGGLGKMLIQLGIVLIIAGVVIHFGSRIFPFGNLPGDIPFGNLPGDIHVEGKHGSFYFPWVSCIVISIVLSLLAHLFR